MRIYLFSSILLLILTLITLDANAQRSGVLLEGWKTDISKRSIKLDELLSGGPPKDGIPSINEPKFTSIKKANSWLMNQEPVILVTLGDEARAYPLQILTWHEIVNDEMNGRPIIVTFCPLCYAALAFDRRVEGSTYSFGVSGMLRHSDMVMYDRETETLWQQLNGEAIVGTHTGIKLEPVPAQILSYEQFKSAYPSGKVLSKDTGHLRDYGRNPYTGYDDIKERPFLYNGPFDKRVPPMEKLVTISLGEDDKAYPHSLTRKKGVINDMVNNKAITVFHSDGAVSALDDSRIAESKHIGTTGVFLRTVDGNTLTFSFQDGQFVDKETNTVWDITGRALEGPLSGAQLSPIAHGNFFAFAWFAFKPGAELFK